MHDTIAQIELTFKRGGAPHSFRRELTATGSVADKMDPHVKASQMFHPYGRTQTPTNAVRPVPTNTKGKAMIKH